MITRSDVPTDILDRPAMVALGWAFCQDVHPFGGYAWHRRGGAGRWISRRCRAFLDIRAGGGGVGARDSAPATMCGL